MQQVFSLVTPLCGVSLVHESGEACNEEDDTTHLLKERIASPKKHVSAKLPFLGRSLQCSVQTSAQSFFFFFFFALLASLWPFTSLSASFSLWPCEVSFFLFITIYEYVTDQISREPTSRQRKVVSFFFFFGLSGSDLRCLPSGSSGGCQREERKKESKVCSLWFCHAPANLSQKPPDYLETLVLFLK